MTKSTSLKLLGLSCFCFVCGVVVGINYQNGGTPNLATAKESPSFKKATNTYSYNSEIDLSIETQYRLAEAKPENREINSLESSGVPELSALSDLAANQIVDTLVSAYQNSDGTDYNKFEALLESGLLNDPFVIEQFVESYAENRLNENSQAYKDLIFLANRENVGAVLIELSDSLDREKQLASIELINAMNMLGNPEVLPAVTNLLESSGDSEVVSASLGALSYQPTNPNNEARIKNLLVNKLDHDDPLVRAKAAARLVEWDKGNTKAPLILKTLQEKDEAVNNVILDAIAQDPIGNKMFKEGLIDLIFEPEVPQYMAKTIKNILLHNYALDEEEYELLHDL